MEEIKDEEAAKALALWKRSRSQSLLALLKDQDTLAVLEQIALQLRDIPALLSLREDCADYYIETYGCNQLLKLFFEDQLDSLKEKMSRLPDGRASISEFVVLALEVLKVPSQFYCFAANGLREMFGRAGGKVDPRDGVRYLSFEQFMRFNIQSHPMPPTEEPQTKFLLRFRESKSQSTIFHEHGIARIQYSNTRKLLLVLDEEQNHIKLIDQSMRLLARLAPHKDKFAGKLNTNIVAFGWSQIHDQVLMSIEQGSIVQVKVGAFLQDRQGYADKPQNQVATSVGIVFSYIVYIEMMNLWLGLSTNGQTFRLDSSKPEKQRCQPLDLCLPEKKVLKKVVQVSPKNQILLVYDNIVVVYNDRMTSVIAKLVHTSEIEDLRVGGQSGDIYLIGMENSVTKYTFNGKSFAVKMIEGAKQRILSFEVFQSLEVIMLIDGTNQLKLIDQSPNRQHQTCSLKHMKKGKGSFRITRLLKNSFIVTKQQIAHYQLGKEAIQAEYNISLLPRIEVVESTLFLGMNDQLLEIDLTSGLAVQNYSWENTNNDCGLRTFIRVPGSGKLLLLDQQNSLKELYEKGVTEGSELTSKKILPKPCGNMFLAAQHNLIFVHGEEGLYVYSYSGNNSYNILRSLSTHPPYKIKLLRIHPRNFTLTILTKLDVLVLNSNTFAGQAFCFDRTIVHFLHLPQVQMLFLITENCELFLLDQDRLFYLKTDLRITRCKLLQLKRSEPKGLTQPLSDDEELGQERVERYLIFFEETGQLMKINFNSTYERRLATDRDQASYANQYTNLFNSFSVIVGKGDLPSKQYQLGSAQKLDQGRWGLGQLVRFKAHERQVLDMGGFFLEQKLFVTIGKEGRIKTWTNRQELVMEIILPTFSKACNRIAGVLAPRNERSLKRTEILMSRLLARKGATRLNLKEINELLKAENNSGPTFQEYVFMVNQMKSKAELESGFSWPARQSVHLRMSPRETKMDRLFDSLCQQVNNKHPNDLVPQQILDTRRQIHYKQDLSLRQKLARRTIFRIKKLGGYKKTIIDQFTERVGEDPAAERLLELDDLPIPKPVEYQIKLQDLKAKIEANRFKKRVSPQKRSNQLDQIDKEFAKRRASVGERPKPSNNRKKQSSDLSEHSQFGRAQGETDVAGLLGKMKRLFDEEKRKIQFQRKERERKFQERQQREQYN